MSYIRFEFLKLDQVFIVSEYSYVRHHWNHEILQFSSSCSLSFCLWFIKKMKKRFTRFYIRCHIRYSLKKNIYHSRMLTILPLALGSSGNSTMMHCGNGRPSMIIGLTHTHVYMEGQRSLMKVHFQSALPDKIPLLLLVACPNTPAYLLNHAHF